MSQSTAHTGPSGLIHPDTLPTPTTVNGDLEAALQTIRHIARRPTPAPLSDSVRFSIETAKGLADHATDLYPMSTEVAGRFRLISTLLTPALTEADEQAQR